MYAADRLLTHYGAAARVDILDKSPVPFGLVRSGVAPDHASTKSVTNRFEKVLNDRFFGNAALGHDVSVDDLAPRYHAVVLAYGAAGDRTLDVPGEDTLLGALSARRFVGWFNGDPGAHGDDPSDARRGDEEGAPSPSLHDEIARCLTNTETMDVSVSDGPRRSAVIFGLGNVALDCARILLRDPKDLRATDICAAALATLERSAVEHVALVGRRGVAQAAFSPKELRELLDLPDVDVRVYDDAVAERTRRTWRRAARAAARAGDREKEARGNPLSERESVGSRKELSVRFLRSPKALVARDDDRTRLGSVVLEVNELTGPPGSAPSARHGRDGDHSRRRARASFRRVQSEAAGGYFRAGW